MQRILQWLLRWWRSVVNGQPSVVLSCIVTWNNYLDIIFLLNPMEGKCCHVKLTPQIPILVHGVVWFPRGKVSSNAQELTFTCFCWAVYIGSMPCFLYLLSPLDSAGILLHLSEPHPVVNSSRGSILCFDYHEPYPTGFTFWTTQRDSREAFSHYCRLKAWIASPWQTLEHFSWTWFLFPKHCVDNYFDIWWFMT